MTSIAPPIVELGRAADWSPLPLSIRDARRAAAPLRARGGPGCPAPPRARPCRPPAADGPPCSPPAA
ncbi:hypothetical protein ACFV7Q_09580 [Streptomyces sp. NPDC059851]|uniref:hypothetical protein n=1 Tax=Streptomyces sp. NPDC059851 TaxID=3346971 RepID=UPI003658EDC9